MDIKGNAGAIDIRFEDHMQQIMNNAIARMSIDLKRRKYPAFIKQSRLDDVNKNIPVYQEIMRKDMEPDETGRITLDQHKLAAIAAAEILNYKPLMSRYEETEYEEYRINAILAFSVGIDILAMYDIMPSCVDPAVRNRIFRKIRPVFPYPSKIKDKKDIPVNLIYAFEQVAKSQLQEDLNRTLWLFSNTFYFLDYISKETMMDLVQAEYERIRAQTA